MSYSQAFILVCEGPLSGAQSLAGLCHTDMLNMSLERADQQMTALHRVV